MLNRLENGSIIPTKLPPDRPFVGGEETSLNGVAILEYWQWATFWTETPATPAMTKRPPKDLPIAR